MNPRPCPSAPRGFTLVEILVGVVMLAALAGLTTIAVRSGIRSSHRAGCVSNLRQIAVGLELYLQEHGQRMPVWVAGRRTRGENVPALETGLVDYVESELVFRCPADPGEFEKSGSSYLWNHTLNGQAVSQLAFFTTDDPSRIPLVLDKESWHPGGQEGSTNFLYADRTTDNRLRLEVNRQAEP